MSYARPERQARRAKRIALEAARQQGCVCHAEARVVRVAGVAVAALAHDDWCPLLRVKREGTGGEAWDVVIAPADAT